MKRYQVNNIDYKNILITSGAQQGLAYLAKGMIEPGSVVVVENPSYPGALDTFRSYGAEIVGVGMDDDGMKMDALEQVLQQHKRWLSSTPLQISRIPPGAVCLLNGAKSW